MLSRENNELLTQVGPGTAMGELMRAYWAPAAFSDKLEGMAHLCVCVCLAKISFYFAIPRASRG